MQATVPAGLGRTGLRAATTGHAGRAWASGSPAWCPQAGLRTRPLSDDAELAWWVV
jgi:hypothetical protein